MAIDARLLEVLVCPADHGQLTHAGDGEAETLTCGTCTRIFPVINGIPSLLLDDASIGKGRTDT